MTAYVVGTFLKGDDCCAAHAEARGNHKVKVGVVLVSYLQIAV